MRQKLADYRIFVREFRDTFKNTGALLPSGAQLARCVTRPFKESPLQGRRLMEVGPGTGAVTDRIVRLLREGDHLTLVEINDRFVERLNRRFREEPHWKRVAHLVDVQCISLLDFDPEEKFDYIISGMPMNNFEVPLATALFDRLYELLKSDATLSFFEYVAIRKMKAMIAKRDERTRLESIGGLVKGKLGDHGVGSDLILANVPPAWVHHVKPNVVLEKAS